MDNLNMNGLNNKEKDFINEEVNNIDLTNEQTEQEILSTSKQTEIETDLHMNIEDKKEYMDLQADKEVNANELSYNANDMEHESEPINTIEKSSTESEIFNEINEIDVPVSLTPTEELFEAPITLDYVAEIENIAYANKTSSNSSHRRTNPQRNRNFGKAVAAFALVATITAGSFTLGVRTGITVSDARDPQESIEAMSQIPYTQSSIIDDFQASNPIISNDLQGLALSPNPDSISGIYKSVSPSVVSINVKGYQMSLFNQSFPIESAGSGIIFKEDDEKVYIVTNYHVISEASEVSISIDDTVQVPANYIGGSENDDIAIIAVNKSEMINAGITEYSIAAFADSDTISIGDTAIAIGNASGEGKSATLGIISAINKEINIENQILSVIQTDAAINPGNSGGALVNGNGQVIGINTAKLFSSGVEGMGYAIPSNTVNVIIDNILGQGQLESAYLGVDTRTITEEIKSAYNLPSYGVYINSIVQNSSAADADLRQGDIITAVDGQSILTYEELSTKIKSSKVGSTLNLTIIRNGRDTINVDVKLKNEGLNF